MTEVRRIIDGLRPTALDTLKLPDAIRRHAETVSASVPVRVEAADLPALPPPVENAAYRITTEALTNAARHARASEVRVRLAAPDGALEITVSDDGCGRGPRGRRRGADLDAPPGRDAGRPARRRVRRRRHHRDRHVPAGAAVTAPSAPAPRPVRVVIADDHPMFRYGLRAALAAGDEVEVVGEAADGRELLALVNTTQPDVVLTDLAMPALDGAAAATEILARHPGTGVLVLTMHDDDEALFGALRAGARGYLLKGADRDEIVRAVLTVADGEAVYGAAVARRITDFFTGAHRDFTATAFPELTDRERQVLELVAAGCGNHDIARRFALSEKTVRNHVSAVLVKLQVRDRAAAVAKARDAGLGRSRT